MAITISEVGFAPPNPWDFPTPYRPDAKRIRNLRTDGKMPVDGYAFTAEVGVSNDHMHMIKGLYMSKRLEEMTWDPSTALTIVDDAPDVPVVTRLAYIVPSNYVRNK